jgi:hypothetical protein
LGSTDGISFLSASAPVDKKDKCISQHGDYDYSMTALQPQ